VPGLLRPPLAQDRLRLRSDGQVVVELKHPWHDGTTELLEKLAALVPRPEINLTLYHAMASRPRTRGSRRGPRPPATPFVTATLRGIRTQVSERRERRPHNARL
jgi:hypothetical protein